MKEHPILFSTEMVRAILDGRKTQTRRIVKPGVVKNIEFAAGRSDGLTTTSEDLGLRYGTYIVDDGSGEEEGPEWCIYCAEYPEEGVIPIGQGYGKPGDMLYVRETWRPSHGGTVGYKADFPDGVTGWKPAIHMPRWASRITLEITEVKIERLCEITQAEVFREGLRNQDMQKNESAQHAFACLWNSINEKRGYGWHKNPWVWVLTFKRVHHDTH